MAVAAKLTYPPSGDPKGLAEGNELIIRDAQDPYQYYLIKQELGWHSLYKVSQPEYTVRVLLCTATKFREPIAHRARTVRMLPRGALRCSEKADMGDGNGGGTGASSPRAHPWGVSDGYGLTLTQGLIPGPS